MGADPRRDAVFCRFRVSCTSCAVCPLFLQVRNAMDRARMNSAIRVFNSAVIAEGDGGMVSEKVRRACIAYAFTRM